MGARPSSFRKGGGFLNGVDATITGYEFTDEFNGEAFKPGKDPRTKKERFHSLYAALNARADGADEDVTTTLFVGGYDDFDISEDGHTLSSDEDRQLGANTAFGKLIASLVEAGFPETSLPEDEINFEAIIGTRVRFEQVDNPEDTKKLGKRKGKDGREYNRQDLMVTLVYDLPGATTKPNGKAAKPTASSKPTDKPVKGKPTSKPEPADVREKAAETLVAILSGNGGKIAKSKLSMQILKRLVNDPDREEVRKTLYSDEYLETGGVAEEDDPLLWAYDPTSKDQVIALAK